jgi:hypothetical protein
MTDIRNALHGLSLDDSRATVVHDGVVTHYVIRGQEVVTQVGGERTVQWSATPQIGTPDEAHRMASEWMVKHKPAEPD